MMTDKHDFVVLEAKRFEELVKKEQIADGLIAILHKKAVTAMGMTNGEIKLIDNFYNAETPAVIDQKQNAKLEAVDASMMQIETNRNAE